MKDVGGYGLGEHLASERDQLLKALPHGLTQLPGIGDDNNVPAAAKAAEDARRRSRCRRGCPREQSMDTDTARSLSASTRVQVYLPHEGNYRQGHPGGPGRPKGSRNRMQADTLAGLQFSWQIPQLF
jgi:hypothetical protein